MHCSMLSTPVHCSGICGDRVIRTQPIHKPAESRLRMQAAIIFINSSIDRNTRMKILRCCIISIFFFGCQRPPFEKTEWRIERITIDNQRHDFNIRSDSCVNVKFERAKKRRGYFMGKMLYSNKVTDRNSDYYVRNLRFANYFLRKDGGFQSHLSKKMSFVPYSSPNKITNLLGRTFEFEKGSYILKNDKLIINGEASYRLVSDTIQLKRKIQIFLSK